LTSALPPEIQRLWARTRLHLWPETYMLVSLPRELAAPAALLAGRATGFAALVLERDEASLALAEGLWRASELRGRERAVQGALRVLTFDIDLDLDVCGYLAPAAQRLAAASVSIVPQCGFLKDHLLLPAAKAEQACAVLEQLIAEAQAELA